MIEEKKNLNFLSNKVESFRALSTESSIFRSPWPNECIFLFNKRFFGLYVTFFTYWLSYETKGQAVEMAKIVGKKLVLFVSGIFLHLRRRVGGIVSLFRSAIFFVIIFKS